MKSVKNDPSHSLCIGKEIMIIKTIIFSVSRSLLTFTVSLDEGWDSNKKSYDGYDIKVRLIVRL